MIWILALPSIIFGVISLMVSLSLVFGFYRLVTGIYQRIRLYFDTRYQPRIIHLDMSEQEIKRRFTEIDNREYGFNPQRQDYAPIELFPKPPCLKSIQEHGKKLFPLLNLKQNPKVTAYQQARDWFVMMLVHRALQIERGQWDAIKQRLWADFPCRPKQMAEIDSVYFDWACQQYGIHNSKVAVC